VPQTLSENYPYSGQLKEVPLKRAACLLALLCLGLPAEAQSEGATLQVNAPPGIKIFVDDAFKGDTTKAAKGLILKDLPPGAHVLRAVKERFSPEEKTVTLVSGQVYAWTIGVLVPKLKISEHGTAGQSKVVALVGEVEIQTVPTACVINVQALKIKGAKKTKSLWRVANVPIGTYSFSFTGAGKPVFSRDLAVEAGITLRVRIDLVAQTLVVTKEQALGSLSPPAPLPPGIRKGPGKGEFTSESDRSILVWVPPSTFRMGTTDERYSLPVHEVKITRGFFIAKREVTWGQFRRFCEATKRRPPAGLTSRPAPDDHPVFNVSWRDAHDYCRWAKLRLPTEAEWELAARGSDGRVFPWGSTHGTDPKRANLAEVAPDPDTHQPGRLDGQKETASAGGFPGGASPFGCLNMIGNVREWVADAFALYTSERQVNPTGPDVGPVDRKSQRVNRGGDWNDVAPFPAARRHWDLPTSRDTRLGFRVCR
jgi:formylglycine-generating enzyme required for sulfatase activity